MAIKSIKKIKTRGTVATIVCDTCFNEKEYDHCDHIYLNKPFHYCSKKCFHRSLKNGKSAEARTKNLLDKYGVDSVSKLSFVKEKAKATCRQKYGTDNVSQNEDIKNKKRSTCIKNYGVNSPLKSDIVFNKLKDTNIKKYGHENVMQVDEIKEKFKKEFVEKYGATNPSMIKEFRDKAIDTLYNNYGVKNTMYSDFIKSKFDFKENTRKAHETKKKNGTYKQSKIELKLYKELVETFNDVKYQHLVNGWLIDFYIVSLDLYFQFDGVYWHGLNRPIEQIKICKNERDKNILRKIEIDAEQNAWFKSNNIKLIRITDKFYKKEGIKGVLDKINDYK